MSIEVDFSRTMAPAECERGKYLTINTPSLTSLGYPVSGRGKYCEMVYVVNPVTLNGTVSCDLIEIENMNVSSTVSAIPMLTNTSSYQSITLTSNSSSVITFTPKVTLLEVFNDDSTNKVYLSFNTTTFSLLTAQGLPIEGGAYYSIERDITQATVGSVSGCDLRIIGHRRS